MIQVDLDDLQKYETILSDPNANIADRTDSLFCVKAFQGVEAVHALVRSFHCEPRSELLKHEICYCLGQMNRSEEHNKAIQEFLEHVIDEKNGYEEIVVHEAVEAMGNLSDENTLQLLKKYEDQNQTTTMLYETCFLEKELIEWNKATDTGKSEGIDFKKLKFKTNDPAPPYNIYTGDQESIAQNTNIGRLREILLNKNEQGESLEHNLFDRYRALFTLREINTQESCLAICQTLLPDNEDTCGALLKHEVAYVLAQMEDLTENSVPYLIGSVFNDNEAPIVRHEALIAVGEMINEKAKLEHLLEHKEQIVVESCMVAIRNIENRLAEQEWERQRAEEAKEQ